MINCKHDSDADYRVVSARNGDALAEHAVAWQQLAEQALEPNPFYEPWMLIPAWRAFGQAGHVHFVFVYRHGADNSAPRLCGFFPLERRRFKTIPILGMWQHLHCFLGTPLVLPDETAACLDALRRWARRDPVGAPLLELSGVAGDGPFAHALGAWIRDRSVRSFVVDSHTRAFWQARADAESYMQAALSSGGRQDFRRKRKRLGQTGRLEMKVLEDASDVEQWTKQFLELEASGWKGTAGTALAQSPIERHYFEEIVRAGHARGQVQMLGLFLDGKPIALKCNFLAGDGAFVFKPAYDETYARFSPGALLELDNIHLNYGSKPVRWADSCAAPDNPMWNRLWLERRTIQSLLISNGSVWGNVLLAGVSCLLRGTRHVKRLVLPRPSPLAPRP